MTEIRVRIDVFKRLARKAGNPVFESKDAVVTFYGPILLVGVKDLPDRVYKRSLPFVSLGVSGVASHDWGGPLDGVEEE